MTAPRCSRCFGRDAGTPAVHIIEDGTPDGDPQCAYHASQAVRLGKQLRP